MIKRHQLASRLVVRIRQTVATPPQLVRAFSRDKSSRPDHQTFKARSRTSSLTLRCARTFGSDLVVRPSDAVSSLAQATQLGSAKTFSRITASGVHSDSLHRTRRSRCSQCWYPSNARIHYPFSCRARADENARRRRHSASPLAALPHQRLVPRVVSNRVPPPRMIVLRHSVLLRTLGVEIGEQT